MDIYMDVCCLCRPFDEQTQYRIRNESDAVKEILSRCNDEFNLVLSEMTLEEIHQIPDPIKRVRVLPFISLAKKIIRFDDDIINRMYELRKLQIKTADAFHIACAEKAHALFFTTDDIIVKIFIRNNAQFHTIIKNPSHWLEKEGE